MISVALVDDHKLLRSGLSNFINNVPGFEVLFEADNGKELQKKIKPYRLPHIVLMDINMPLMDGYETTQWLLKHHPAVKVLALSMYDEELCIIRMLRCGAKGYVLKDTEPEELLKALEEVHANGYYYTPTVQKHMSQVLSTPEKENDDTLTQREINLLKFLATDLTYKEIADKMNVSTKTIEGYRERLSEKLYIRTRVGLVIFAIKNGIVYI